MVYSPINNTKDLFNLKIHTVSQTNLIYYLQTTADQLIFKTKCGSALELTKNVFHTTLTLFSRCDMI